MRGQRRYFLVLSAAGLFAPLAFAFPKTLKSADPSALRAKKCLRRTISEWEAARTIGKKYLCIHPQEADPATLLTDVKTPADFESPRYLRKRLAELKRRDFENEDIVIIDGWVLARTEARICALICMI